MRASAIVTTAAVSKNALLAAVSFAVTWLLLELLVFPLALPLLPLRIHAGLPRPLRPLAQSSKALTLPERYVALVGDSHAQGAGDWLLSVDASRNPPFHSAHLLREKTGLDVISFGASGAGSLRAMGTEPQAYLDALQRSWRYRLPDPELLLVYFYEGNDLQDNLRDLDHTYFAGGFDPARVYDGDSFRDFVRATAAARTPVAEEVETWHWTDNFFLARFVLRVAGAALDRSWQAAEPAPDWRPGEVNRAAIGGAERALPDGLQAPPLELSAEELELALWADAQAFALLRGRFPHARALVVYLPSPLATYRITSSEVDVQLQRGEGAARFARAALAERSDLVCGRIEAITRAGGGEFVDARPALWEAAAREPVHGPRDWKHLNRVGQERLATLVAAELARQEHGTCGSLRAQLESSG
jgi:hypothetical protein